MLKQRLEQDLKQVIKDLGFEVGDIVCSIPKNSQFGDYTTNIALQIANQKGSSGKHSPLDIANKIIDKFNKQEFVKEYIEKTEAINPGFINFYFKTNSLMQNLHLVCDYSYLVQPDYIQIEGDESKQKILIEYAQPNTHKAFHIGHTRNIAIGESLARLLESQGNKIYRCTYGSDIGLPVAKAVWGVMHLEEAYKQIKKGSIQEKAEFLGAAYAKGATLYEEDEKVKEEIDQINKAIYLKEPKVTKIWEETKEWSLQYLNQVYTKLGTKFDGVYVESQVESIGKKIVEDNINKIFKEDAGAIIFPGEEYGLHNRVFITAQKNPTYEAKELGLAELEYSDFHYDRAYHLVASEQSGYFKVIFKVIDLLFSDLAGKKVHLSYEMVDLKGKKMSSRTGDVVTFDYLFDEVRKRVAKIMAKSDLEEKNQIIDLITVGAIKFTMLKYSPQTKIYFDLEKSVALDGDSGPYIQYTYARAKSVLRTASYNYQPKIEAGELEDSERELLQKIEHFQILIKDATQTLNPTLLTSFLLDTAKIFNVFYQKHPIIKAEEKAEFRLALTCAIAVILKQGLYLLGIEAPERM